MILGKSWGPYTWYLLHNLSFTWEKRKINLYHKFFNLLKETIPCYTCYTNFKKKLSRPNFAIHRNCSDKDKMVQWIINLHNEVNRSKGTRAYSLEEVKSLYLKNGKIIFNNKLVLIFIKEFVVYNMTLDGPRKKKALQLLQVLAMIYPSIKRRMRLMNYVRTKRRMSLMRWVQGYINCLR